MLDKAGCDKKCVGEHVKMHISYQKFASQLCD